MQKKKFPWKKEHFRNVSKYKIEIIKWWQDLNLRVNWPIKASSLKVVFKYTVLSEI